MNKNKKAGKENLEKELEELIEENKNRSTGIKKIINSIDNNKKITKTKKS